MSKKLTMNHNFIKMLKNIILIKQTHIKDRKLHFNKIGKIMKHLINIIARIKNLRKQKEVKMFM
jgi:hypothetical protein